MSDRIFVERVRLNGEPGTRKVLDTRTWNEHMPNGVVRIECPEQFNRELSFRVRLRRKGVVKFERTTKVRRGNTSIDLILSREEEKIFQTGPSPDPFKLEVSDVESSSTIYTAVFFRFKSDKSKLYKEVRVSESLPVLPKPHQKEAGDDDEEESEIQEPDVLVRSLDINGLFERGQNRLEHSLLCSSSSTEPIELSSIKPSFNQPNNWGGYRIPPTSTFCDSSDDDQEYASCNFRSVPNDSHDDFHGFILPDPRDQNYRFAFDCEVDDDESSSSYAIMTDKATSTSTPSIKSTKTRVNGNNNNSFSSHRVPASSSRFTDLESVISDDYMPSSSRLAPQDISNISSKSSPLVSTSTNNVVDLRYAFTIIVDEGRLAQKDSRCLRPGIYLVRNEKVIVSNHAIRSLVKQYGVKYVAQFKIEIKINFKTRSGMSHQNPSKYKDDLLDLLTNGIEVDLNGRRVSMLFVGNSNSGLRESTFWAIDQASYEHIDFGQFLRELGDFHKLRPISKLSKRYALAFSASRESISLDESEYVCVDDDFSPDGRFQFTEGIGLMRNDVARQISRILNLERESNVFQIRCGGFKGVLVAMPDKIFDRILTAKCGQRVSSRVRVIFRDSQRKFNHLKGSRIVLNVVSWVDHIIPPSSLNCEFLMVLDGLAVRSGNIGIKTYLYESYKKSLDELDESLTSPSKAYAKLFGSGMPVSEFSVKYGWMIMSCKYDLRQELDFEQYKIIRNQIIDQWLYKAITKQKFNIPIAKSRYMMGVVDETATLNENEVYVAYRDLNGKVQYLDGDVIVARTPCYGLSEIRRVRARKVPDLLHLVNVIAFPKRGRRPLTNLLSGGDLDGDLYFVSWDETLITIENAPSFIDYPNSTSSEEAVATSSKRLDDAESIRAELAHHFVTSCLRTDSIGLLHYGLVCMYDSDRNKMQSRAYADTLININRLIDQQPLVTASSNFNQEPIWYISNSKLPLNQAQKKDEKLVQFFNYLNEWNRKLNVNKLLANPMVDSSTSLLGLLAYASIQKYIDLFQREALSSPLDARFLTAGEISVLDRLGFVDLDLFDDQLCQENVEKIKRMYDQHLVEYMRLVEPNNYDNCFMGAVERNEVNRRSKETERAKNELVAQFKQRIIRLPYNLDTDNEDERIVGKLKLSSLNIFLNTRVVRLYETLRATPKYYQIPWIFYDVMCFLKQQVAQHRNNTNNNSHNTSNMIPVCVPTSWMNAFSIEKLKNLRIE